MEHANMFNYSEISRCDLLNRTSHALQLATRQRSTVTQTAQVCVLSATRTAREYEPGNYVPRASDAPMPESETTRK